MNEPGDWDATCSEPEKCGVCHNCHSYEHDTAAHKPTVEELEAALRASEERLRLVEVLIDTDDKVEYPQPHPRVLTLAAAARSTMREMGQRLREKDEEIARLTGELWRLKKHMDQCDLEDFYEAEELRAEVARLRALTSTGAPSQAKDQPGE